MSSGLFTTIVFVTRKPGLSPAEFKDYYENTHVPLLQSLAGSLFPISHTRHYLARDLSHPDHPPIVVYGAPEGFDYDVMVEVIFESQAALLEFRKVMVLPEVLADEDRFTDPRKLRAVVMGETTITKRASTTEILFSQP